LILKRKIINENFVAVLFFYEPYRKALTTFLFSAKIAKILKADKTRAHSFRAKSFIIFCPVVYIIKFFQIFPFFSNIIFFSSKQNLYFRVIF
jgi:hypothetical protein